MTFIKKNNFFIDNRISCLDKKVDKLIELNEKFYEIIIQNNKLFNKYNENQMLFFIKQNNKEIDSIHSSISSISLDLEVKNNELKEPNHEIEETKLTEEDNELLNECYDNIPCNNYKKITGLSNFLNWI